MSSRETQDQQSLEIKNAADQDYYRLLADNISEIFIHHTPDGLPVYISPSCKSLLGYEPSALIGRSLVDIVHSDDVDRVVSAMTRTVTGSEVVKVEYRVITSQGESLWLETTAKTVVDPDTMKRKGIITISRDITARRQLEHELLLAGDEMEERVRERTAELEAKKRKLEFTIQETRRISSQSASCEAHLSSLLESTSDFAIYRLATRPDKPMSLEVVFVSPSIMELMGVTEPQDFNTWFDNIHPEDRPRVIKANLEARKTNRFDESMRIFHPIKNEWRWIHSISTGVPDKNGLPLFVNGIIVDITNQKLAEGELIKMQNELESRVLARTLDLENLNKRLKDEIKERELAEIALKESEEKYRNIVENSPDILYGLDGRGIFEAINIPNDDFYGYKSKDVVGQEFVNFIYPEDRERVFNSFITAVETRREWTRGLQFRILAKNDETPWLELNSHMQFDENGNYIKEEGILRDITDRKISEVSLIRAYDELEQRVQERTAELSAINKSLKQEILDRKRAEEQKQKLEEKLRRSQKLEAIGTLAGGIAHDFNNILSAVIGYAQLAEMETPDDTESKGYLAEIVRASRRATELIRHILTFSRQYETEKSRSR